MQAASIPALVEAAAAKDPDALALVDGERRFTYLELMTMAESTAAAILESSSSPVVGVLMAPSAWTTVAALGVMRAGRAYLPLDPCLPEERLRRMTGVLDCECLLVDAEPDCGSWFGGSKLIGEAVAAVGRPCPEPAVQDPDRLAYVIFTSGSTGEPKAVGVGQGPAATVVQHTVGRLRLRAEDRVLQIHSTSFDASIEEVWSTLAAGAMLTVPHDGILDIPGVVEQMIEHRVSVLHMPIGYWRALVHEFLDGLPAAGLDALRYLDTGGEAMRLDDLRAWRESPLREVTLNNGYGPTEAVVTASSFTLGPETQLPDGVASVPIGRALPGRILYVVDESGCEVEVGEAGELYIAGDLLAAGYLNDAELTARRFPPDAARGQGRKYRTGDLVRKLPNGALEFLRRTDDQVKVRGFRIELGEISHVLRSLEGIRDAAAVVIDPTTGRLGAAVVLERGSGQGSPDFGGELALKLPACMIPSVIVPIDRLPTSVVGKVDSSELRRLLGESIGSE